MDEKIIKQLTTPAWSGTAMDFQRLVERAVELVEDAANGPAVVTIECTFSEREIPLDSPDGLAAALESGQDLKRVSARVSPVERGAPLDVIVLNGSFSSMSGVNGYVEGRSDVIVPGVQQSMQADLDAGARWWGWETLGSRFTVFSGGLVAAAVVLALIDFDIKAIGLMLLGAMATLVLALLLLLGPPEFVARPFNLHPEGHRSRWQRWRGKVATGAWGVALVVLGVVLGKLL